jgi:sulfur carrier protein ThiS
MIVRVGKTGSEKKEMETEAKTVGELLRELDTNPETVIVRQNSSIRTIDSPIQENDEIEIISVVSGG